jgi:hypothetical protein
MLQSAACTVSLHFTKILISKFRSYELLQWSVYTALGPSPENKLAHPISSEQNRTLANENTKDATSSSQSVKPGQVRGAVFCVQCFAVLWASHFQSICNKVFPLLVYVLFEAIQLSNSFLFFIISLSFGNVTSITTFRLWEIAIRFTNSLQERNYSYEWGLSIEVSKVFGKAPLNKPWNNTHNKQFHRYPWKRHKQPESYGMHIHDSPVWGCSQTTQVSAFICRSAALLSDTVN